MTSAMVLRCEKGQHVQSIDQREKLLESSQEERGKKIQNMSPRFLALCNRIYREVRKTGA